MLTRKHRAALLLATALVFGCATPPPIPENALVGKWRQQDGQCGVTLDVKELEFRADGWFSVTWRPFETYRDYVGSWSFNERTRELELTIEGGNNRPSDFIGQGRIRLSENLLDLGDISLGSAYGRAPCVAPFERIAPR